MLVIISSLFFLGYYYHLCRPLFESPDLCQILADKQTLNIQLLPSCRIGVLQVNLTGRHLHQNICLLNIHIIV